MAQRSTQQNRFRLDWILVILLIPGLIAALTVGMNRHRMESTSRTVELTLDYNELQNLSVSSGTPMPELLKQFKAAGITGIAVNEELVGDFVSTGEVTYSTRTNGSGPLTVIHISDPALLSRMSKTLGVRLGHVEYDAKSLSVPAAPGTLNGIGLGLPPASVKMIQAAGLDVVARLQNHPALTKRTIDAAMADLEANGIRRLICASEEVYGYRGLIEYTAKKIEDAGLVYGSIEFSKQRGDAKMCRELDSDFIRVHSISVAEMGSMAPSSIVERFTRAVKERDIKLCYVRLPQTTGEDPLKDSLDFVSSVSGEIKESGYQVGIAEPFGPIARPMPMLILMALSIAAGGVLLLTALFSMSPAVRYSLLALGFAVAAGLTMAEMGRKVDALVAALIFPTLGVIAIAGKHFKHEHTEKSPALRAAGMFLGMSLVSLCGALLVVGLLSDRSYMVKVNQFMGIKAAHGLPLLFAGFFMAAGLPIFGKPFANVRKEIAENIRKLVNNPLFVWHAIAAVVMLGFIGFALMRTGNDSAVGVSGLELKFRAILDRLLVVRPRTKEFLIGHPAMFLGLALLMTRRRNWGLPLVAFGMLGQASLLNTFCHIHSPIGQSIIRATNGLILGLLIGFAVWIVFVRPKRARPDKP